MYNLQRDFTHKHMRTHICARAPENHKNFSLALYRSIAIEERISSLIIAVITRRGYIGFLSPVYFTSMSN